MTRRFRSATLALALSTACVALLGAAYIGYGRDRGDLRQVYVTPAFGESVKTLSDGRSIFDAGTGPYDSRIVLGRPGAYFDVTPPFANDNERGGAIHGASLVEGRLWLVYNTCAAPSHTTTWTSETGGRQWTKGTGLPGANCQNGSFIRLHVKSRDHANAYVYQHPFMNVGASAYESTDGGRTWRPGGEVPPCPPSPSCPSPPPNPG